MNNYLVGVIDVNGEAYSYICKTKDDLANFLTHLDDDKFKVLNIAVIVNATEEPINFFKENKFEHGGSNSDQQ